MGDVTISKDGIVVEAALVGRAFGITPETVRAEMRSGRITSRCEAGVDEDEGRYRMTFYREGRAFRLVVDRAGQVLSQGRFPTGRTTPPG